MSNDFSSDKINEHYVRLNNLDWSGKKNKYEPEEKEPVISDFLPMDDEVLEDDGDE